MPVRDDATGLPLLWLPAGFRYTSFGWSGDPLRDGPRTPRGHDGMAAFAAGPGRVRLVRNHELSGDDGAFSGRRPYDPAAAGGTTTVEFDTARARQVDAWTSLSGTLTNCAGGPTPWGTWLTCEETIDGPALTNHLTRPHGFVFEVHPDGGSEPTPLEDMGRFVHEAVAVDPATGIVYETEDRSTAGLYRFLPREPGRLAAGGRLQILAVAGQPRYDTRTRQKRGTRLPVEWIDIADPSGGGEELGVFREGHGKGAARFGRLEGAWYGGGAVYVVSTNGGDEDQGQIWAYRPATNDLELIFESPGADVLDNPDNICVSPRGGLALCEDGNGTQFLRCLTRDGRMLPFAQNAVVLDGERNGRRGDFTNREFAGATYSPDGEWLFFNIQTPGITFAVTGPWGDGGL
jgi:secreted PhoX family phosphatase